MPRRPSPTQSKPADWSPKKTYEALQFQLASLEQLRSRHHEGAESAERGWRNFTLNILTHGFGAESNNVQQFNSANVVGRVSAPSMTDAEYQHNFERRIAAFAVTVKSSIDELELEMKGDVGETPRTEGVNAARSNSREVFLVHGHDDAMKEAVARFLEKLNLHPIILHEQPNKGRTVIEKFEGHSDVDFAVVLLSPDDTCGAGEQITRRARQNVILELGYFIGKLGRARVCALYKEGVEIPSDIHGVLYVQFDASDGWRLKLAGEIKAAGIPIDLNLA